MVNTVSLSGKIVTKIEYKTTNKGTLLVKFKLLQCDPSTNHNLLIRIEAWGHTAEYLKDRLSINSYIIVHGKLSQEHWTTNSNNKKSRLKVTANKIILTGKDE